MSASPTAAGTLTPADRPPSPAQSVAASPPPAGEPSAPETEPGALRIVMSASCVRVGDRITAHFTSPPKAALSMIASYNHTGDNLTPGPMHTAIADDHGRYDWTFLIGPEATPGKAQVLAGSSGPDGARDGGGYAWAAFSVQSSCS